LDSRCSELKWDYNFSFIPKHLKSHRDVTGIAWSFNTRRSDYFEMTNLLFGNAPRKSVALTACDNMNRHRIVFLFMMGFLSFCVFILVRNALKISSPFKKCSSGFLFCRDVACYVSKCPTIIRSRCMGNLFSDHS